MFGTIKAVFIMVVFFCFPFHARFKRSVWLSYKHFECPNLFFQLLKKLYCVKGLMHFFANVILSAGLVFESAREISKRRKNKSPTNESDSLRPTNKQDPDLQSRGNHQHGLVRRCRRKAYRYCDETCFNKQIFNIIRRIPIPIKYIFKKFSC